MGEEYVNRKGKRYYLLQGKTKTGKPKYYCSLKPAGNPVETMPEGYEWYEHPADGRVLIRKVRPSRITDGERELLSEGIRKQAGLTSFIIDIVDDSLVVYISDNNIESLVNIFGRLPLEQEQMASLTEYAARHAYYFPMLQFLLDEEEEGRLFVVRRWCERSSMEGWLPLIGSDESAPLAKLIDRYVPHLGKDSFYELI